MRPARWVTDANAALLTDLYQLTMLQSYLEHGVTERAAFELFARRLPDNRNFLLAAGLDDVLAYLETIRFPASGLEYLGSLGRFSTELLTYLEEFRFSGDVRAIAEGTPVFAGEPMLEVVAPLPEAQLVETFVLNQIHLQTLVASKAARVVAAAAGRDVVDFGLRHAHGADAGLKSARAAYVAGASATSDVLAGQVYGIPVAGTMAHSYVQVHDDEAAAFRHFTQTFPRTTLLVDTYDTLEGVRQVVALADELGDRFDVRAIRLDSGQLAELSRGAREILDAAGLTGVRIYASGSLDEITIAELVAQRAPIDGFGVGTLMSVSADAPYLDLAYKLVEYAGTGRMKLSAEKATVPGRKQVFRIVEGGTVVRDVVARVGEQLDGEPLLKPVMQAGERLPAGQEDLALVRRRAEAAVARLPPRIRALEPASPPYPVETSDALRAEQARMTRQLGSRGGRARAPNSSRRSG